MNKTIHDKIMLGCSLSHTESIRLLNVSELAALVDKAAELIDGISDVESDIKAEISTCGSFCEYYAGWFQSIDFRQEYILPMMYGQPNEISDVIGRLDCHDEAKQLFRENIAQIFMKLAVIIRQIEDCLKRQAIANNYTQPIDIYRPQPNLSQFWDSVESHGEDIKAPLKGGAKKRNTHTSRKKTFRDFLVIEEQDKDQYITELHKKIDGKSGRTVIADILNLEIENGIIAQSLTFPAFNEEFPYVVNQSEYSRTKYRPPKSIRKL